MKNEVTFMAKKQVIPSNKKISVSINLECWIWELVERIENNRSKFFRDLLLGKIKEELMNEHVMAEADSVTELLAEVYVNITQYKRNLRREFTGRKPIRRVGNKKEESNSIQPGDSRKKAISINMEQWLWDISAKMSPNRSVFFKDLLLQKIKSELLKAEIVLGNESIGKEHTEAYIHLLTEGKVNKKVS